MLVDSNILIYAAQPAHAHGAYAHLITSHDLADDGTARSVSKTRCYDDIAINDHTKGAPHLRFLGL